MINITCEDEFVLTSSLFTSLFGAKVQLTSSPFYKTLSVNIENSSGNWLSAKLGGRHPCSVSYGEFKLRPTRGLTFHSPSGQRILKDMGSLRSLRAPPFNIVDWWMFGCCGRLAEQNTPLALARVLSSFNPHQLLYVALYSRQLAGAALVFNICV